jgi:hypothetical protein
MSDENADAVQPEKPSVTPQVTPQESKQAEIKSFEFAESAIKNAGDQGISLNPVGGHDTNPFVSQDIVQVQPAVQIVPPTSSTVEAVTQPPSSVSNSDTGE